MYFGCFLITNLKEDMLYVYMLYAKYKKIAKLTGAEKQFLPVVSLFKVKRKLLYYFFIYFYFLLVFTIIPQQFKAAVKLQCERKHTQRK